MAGMEELDARRVEVASACRVLADRGLADGILGHISERVDDRRLLIRCRGPHERGLAYTTAEDIRLVDLDGNPAGPRELDGGYAVPNEFPLHSEVLRARPEIDAVVHAHPPAVVVLDLSNVPIRPIVGAFDIPGARLAAGGVPVYRRSVLIRTAELGRQMVASMNGRPVVVLRGHGLTSAATSVAGAVLQAISIDAIARMSIQIASAGGRATPIPDEDLAELPDLGDGFNTTTAWRHELTRIEDVWRRGPSGITDEQTRSGTQ